MSSMTSAIRGRDHSGRSQEDSRAVTYGFLRLIRTKEGRTAAGMTVTPNRRQENRRQTHQRICQHAMRLFSESGYERVTMGRIAEAAGVSVPTWADGNGERELEQLVDEAFDALQQH
jgi:hypothetical protein